MAAKQQQQQQTHKHPIETSSYLTVYTQCEAPLLDFPRWAHGPAYVYTCITVVQGATTSNLKHCSSIEVLGLANVSVRSSNLCSIGEKPVNGNVRDSSITVDDDISFGEQFCSLIKTISTDTKVDDEWSEIWKKQLVNLMTLRFVVDQLGHILVTWLTPSIIVLPTSLVENQAYHSGKSKQSNEVFLGHLQ